MKKAPRRAGPKADDSTFSFFCPYSGPRAPRKECAMSKLNLEQLKCEIHTIVNAKTAAS